ncbi:FKBP12-associated protein [Saxophila tyrrhenica]|uniref:FKBP12-associated protein n=1 Tax=Saxophila tyrrhenica TaxID=1690608 RepID=A0AAV9PLE3_9PEZI|nr:FKBP12-associated protein [Saxophila tyrrhenica]
MPKTLPPAWRMRRRGRTAMPTALREAEEGVRSPGHGEYLPCTVPMQGRKAVSKQDIHHIEGNAARSLPCNEECQRLERNRKLALALDIDQSTHVEGGDHIPYDKVTLDLFAAHFKWAQTQEREFRVFASSPEEKRLRFKPMKAHERAFVHALASDFGLDSESMDPEPHRHVMIWKTPRFVSAPNKTLAESLRIRQLAQRSTTASANVLDTEGAMKTNAKRASSEPFNAFVISHPKFGLTIDELRMEVEKQVHDALGLIFDIEFLPCDEVVLKAISRTLTGSDLQQVLQGVKTPLITAISGKGYGNAELCAVDGSLNVIRRESDGIPGDGWSKVAAKKSSKGATIPGEGLGSRGTNAFSALGDGKVTFAKKKPVEKVKPKKAVVVDDWEIAEMAEQEKERASGASGASGDEAAGGKNSRSGDEAAAARVDEGITEIGGASGGEASGERIDEAVMDEKETEVDVAKDVEPAVDAVGGDETRDWADQVTKSSLPPQT